MKLISQKDAYEIMNSGRDIVILDVRTPEEFSEGHIKGAINIPNETIGTSPVNGLDDLDKEILVYCRSGGRSNMAAKKLAAAGYTNIKDFGGLMFWPYGITK